MKRIRTKLHTASGFTLMETMLAILILLMVSTIVATGIPVAKNAYEKVVLASNAEVLLSTTVTALRNELGTATDVNVVGTTAVTYYNTTRGASSKIYVDATEGPEIRFQRYIISSSDTEPLISPETATGDLYVTYEKVSYADGIIKFENLSVDRTSGTKGLASRESLSIRVISE